MLNLFTIGYLQIMYQNILESNKTGQPQGKKLSGTNR